MAGTIAPFPKHTFWDNNGAVAASHKLFTYLAGTSTKQTTYSDSALSSANANPIVLGADGRATIFLPPNTNWKFLLCPPTDSDPPIAPLWSVDNCQNVPTGTINVDIDGTAGETLAAGDVVYLSAGSGGLTAGRWYKADADFGYSSSQAGTIGMAVGAITSGTSGSIRIDGRMTGLAGLTAGTTYYASATAGALTSTAPGNAVIVGQADSTTSLVISARAGASSGLGQIVGDVNCLADPTFLMWPAGDATAPAHWQTSGAGLTIARAGTGLGDTTRKVGDFCAKLTSAAGAGATLYQQLLTNTGSTARADYLNGQTVSVGAWVFCATAAKVRIFINNGVTQSNSSDHPGGSVWSWLTATHTFTSSGTFLKFGMEIDAGTVAGYLSGPTFILGPIAPAYYQAAPLRYDVAKIHIPGVQTTGTSKQWLTFQRPIIVKDVQLSLITAPTVTAFIIDVNTWDGAAFTSMFSTRPQIAAGAFHGGARPDTTYARRCMTSQFDSIATGSVLALDIDQIGGGVAGSDLHVFIRYLTYDRPLEELLGYSDIS